jgi:hypothetical protein
MPDISPKIDTHQLKIDLDVQPVREKKKKNFSNVWHPNLFFPFFQDIEKHDHLRVN